MNQAVTEEAAMRELEAYRRGIAEGRRQAAEAIRTHAQATYGGPEESDALGRHFLGVYSDAARIAEGSEEAVAVPPG